MRHGRRRTAARYLRALATLEALVVAGEYGEVRRLIDGIDPEEARSLASELETGRKPDAGRGTGGELALLPASGHSRRPW